MPFTELRLADAVSRDVRRMIANGGEAPRLDESALTGVESELNRMLQFVIVSFIEEGFSNALPVSEEAVNTDPWVSQTGDFTVNNDGRMVVAFSHPIAMQWPGNYHINWAVGMEVTGAAKPAPVTCNVRLSYAGTYVEYPCIVPEGRSTLFGSAVIPGRPKGLSAAAFSLWAQNGSVYVPVGGCEVTICTTPSTGMGT